MARGRGRGPLGMGILPSVRERRKFIQRATMRHRGSLHAFAKKHHALTKRGTINLIKARRAAMRLKGTARLHRLREINLARTLQRFRR